MKRRAPRPPSICGAPGCDREIPRGRLMCRDHWYTLPRPLREAINASWREKRIRDWSANCLEARSFLANHPTAAAAPRVPVTPERAAELRDRILGERTEA